MKVSCKREVSQMFQGCFTEISGVCQEFFKDVSRKFQGCFKKVSCCMALIAASRAEGGLVFPNTPI